MAQHTNLEVRSGARVEHVASDEAVLVSVVGLVDEHFAGFGSLAADVKNVVIDTSKMTRMTSFGVRQWLRAMDGLPRAITGLYLLGCPTFFVDQLNMVVNFGGSAKVLTVMAPFACTACGHDSSEVIDVLAERNALAKGTMSPRTCSRCDGMLELDETPDSYFAFVGNHGATTLTPGAAHLLAAHNLYTAKISAEKPAKILKLVHGTVTYFRISGTIGTQFRARPLVVGAEGEVVLDLAEIEAFEPAGQTEWERLIKNLASQVQAITAVDVGPPMLMAAARGELNLDSRFSIWSVLVPYRCRGCERATNESVVTAGVSWPLGPFKDRVCTSCGGSSRADATSVLLAPLERAKFASVPPESTKVIKRRDELLSRALVDAKVAAAGEPAAGGPDDMLGKYQIVRRLSAGGMAEVFLAKQVGIGGFEKPVALKKIQRQLLEKRHLAVDMFLNEAKIAARLTHPNIVQVLDIGESQGALYLAMEYVNGRDFAELMRRLAKTDARMPIPEACFIVREVAHALHHAFWSTDLDGKRLSVVHRDVSPHNIMLGVDGTVKLLDFGVALSSVTEGEAMVVGKWMYMSPEHTRNADLDHRSDLFSLGVILYQACTGKVPFASDRVKDTVRRIREGDFMPVEQEAPEIPASLARVINSLLSPDPAQRPQDGQRLASMLNDVAREHSMEVSNTDIAQLVADVFADQPKVGRTRLGTASDVSKVTGSGSNYTPDPSSNTPQPPRTSGSLSKVAHDFSVSLVVTPEGDDLSGDFSLPKPSPADSALVILALTGLMIGVLVLIMYLVLWD